jgi:hypothetical protein
MSELRYGNELIILEPFYKKVIIYPDCPHAPYELSDIYEFEIPHSTFCPWCGYVDVDFVEKSEVIIFEKYIKI